MVPSKFWRHFSTLAQHSQIDYRWAQQSRLPGGAADNCFHTFVTHDNYTQATSTVEAGVRPKPHNLLGCPRLWSKKSPHPLMASHARLIGENQNVNDLGVQEQHYSISDRQRLSQQPIDRQQQYHPMRPIDGKRRQSTEPPHGSYYHSDGDAVCFLEADAARTLRP